MPATDSSLHSNCQSSWGLTCSSCCWCSHREDYSFLRSCSSCQTLLYSTTRGHFLGGDHGHKKRWAHHSSFPSGRQGSWLGHHRPWPGCRYKSWPARDAFKPSGAELRTFQPNQRLKSEVSWTIYYRPSSSVTLIHRVLHWCLQNVAKAFNLPSLCPICFYPSSFSEFSQGQARHFPSLSMQRIGLESQRFGLASLHHLSHCASKWP